MGCQNNLTKTWWYISDSIWQWLMSVIILLAISKMRKQIYIELSIKCIWAVVNFRPLQSARVMRDTSQRLNILYAPGQHLRLSINAVLLVDLVDSSPSSPMLLLWLLPCRLQVCQGSKISSSAGQVKTTRGPTPTPTVEPTVQSTETVCVGRHRLKNWIHFFRNSPPRPHCLFTR